MATACMAQTAFRFDEISRPVVARFDQPHASGESMWTRPRIPRTGNSSFALFNAFYDTWCYLPLLRAPRIEEVPIRPEGDTGPAHRGGQVETFRRARGLSHGDAL